MKIHGLVYDVLLEEVKNKKLFNFLLEKWKQEKPTITPDEVEDLLTKFQNFQPALTPDKPHTASFLSRFDGQHGYSKFDESNLKDITKYTYTQILSLISEFNDEDFEAVGQNDVFAGKDAKLTDERLEASKSLWSGSDHAIIDNEGTRVYYIPDQILSMRYGYFEQSMANRLNGVQQWCVTGRNSSDSRTNMWGSYRPRRTFYFIIDDSKSPDVTDNREINKNYLGALQVVRDNNTGYRLTNVLNDGDKEMTWEDLVKLYPKLEGQQELFKFVEFDEDAELENRNIIGRITETEGNRFEFRRMERKYKKAFIQRGGVISKSHSWRSMDRNLRDLYILGTETNNVLDRFQTFELMSEVKKVGSEYNQLDKRLKRIGLNGVSMIYDHLMKNEFEIGRTSIDNSNIRLYKSKKTQKYGLYNGRTAEWITLGGVTYEPTYNEYDTSLYIDDEGSMYVVETYTMGGEPDGTSFYCVSPAAETNENASGHFISPSKFAELQQKLHPQEDGAEDGYRNISDFNPETDTDIKEMKKGV